MIFADLAYILKYTSDSGCGNSCSFKETDILFGLLKKERDYSFWGPARSIIISDKFIDLICSAEDRIPDPYSCILVKDFLTLTKQNISLGRTIENKIIRTFYESENKISNIGFAHHRHNLSYSLEKENSHCEIVGRGGVLLSAKKDDSQFPKGLIITAQKESPRPYPW